MGALPELPGTPSAGVGEAVPDAAAEAVPVPTARSAEPVPNAAAGNGSAGGPVLRILPLGSGLMLIGLGFGLAFVGLRLRQGTS
ncbi:hypothetical protein ACFYOV_06210 [Streptomyces sp. NPDC005931]|uniref:hypothetical protein n=1 Tax=Streptomyces sp. NPDC005931 TaxID=3364737 RepID=UPI003678324E